MLNDNFNIVRFNRSHHSILTSLPIKKSETYLIAMSMKRVNKEGYKHYASLHLKRDWYFC